MFICFEDIIKFGIIKNTLGYMYIYTHTPATAAAGLSVSKIKFIVSWVLKQFTLTDISDQSIPFYRLYTKYNKPSIQCYAIL